MKQQIDAMARRVGMMFGRGVVSRTNDDRQLQALQIEMLADEAHDEVEHFQPYGFAAHAHPGAEAVAAAVGGLRSHMVVLAVADRRYRLTGLPAGEVALYDDQGQIVHLTRDGIVIETQNAVTIRAESVLVEADAVDLGGEGGQPVARVGDSVAGGVITSGSSKVKSA